MRIVSFIPLLTLTSLAFAQQIYYDPQPDVLFRDDRVLRLSTDYEKLDNGPSQPWNSLQVIGGYSYTLVGTNYRYRGFFLWQDHNTGGFGRYVIPVANPGDNYAVTDVAITKATGKVVAYAVGFINPNNTSTYYPFIQSYLWSGTQFAPVNQPQRLSQSNAAFAPKIASNHKGSLYVAWNDRGNKIGYRSIRATATAPYYLAGTEGGVTAASVPLDPNEQFGDVDVAYNVGGAVTFAALVNGGPRNKIISCQLDHATQVQSPPVLEYQTTTENLESLSISSHWMSWLTGSSLYDKDYLIAFAAQGAGRGAINTVGVAQGLRTGVKLVNIFNNEVVNQNSQVSISGSDQFYEVLWTCTDTSGIFPGSGQTGEILSQTADINGQPSSAWPYPHKFINNSPWRAQGYGVVAMGHPDYGYNDMAVAFINDLTDPSVIGAPLERYIAYKVTITGFY